MEILGERLKHFSIELFKINAIKFGEFKTKVGLMTPVYCDLRVIMSYPNLLNDLSILIVDYLNELKPFDIICGVPYTALPVATAVSLKSGIPMVMRRKEVKNHGTKKLIEGNYSKNNNCLIVEDVVTSGSSILETVKDLVDVGVKCTDAIVLLNREQGGELILQKHGIKMHALLNLTQLMGFLYEAELINNDILENVQKYIEKTQISSIKPAQTRLKMSFKERAKNCQNIIGKKLFELMEIKKTNLCVAADLTNPTDILNLAEQVGPYICLFKTHIDIIKEFNLDFIKSLKEIAESHNFLLFEDRKFCDIGKTVQLQFTQGIYEISSWASLITCHSLPGRGILDAIQTINDDRIENKGIFLLAEMSSAGNLIDQNYIKTTLNFVNDYKELITGIVCQNPLFTDIPNLIQLTPGIQFNSINDNLGQQYNSPDIAILEKGADIGVVGRGITQHKDPSTAAESYRNLLWRAYNERINS